MKRIYAVIELNDAAEFNPRDDAHLDDLAEDLLSILGGVESVVVYASAQDLIADEPA